ncbi:hypothetical protein WN944_000619 [Citrus x changshan-huyou]|uniref:Uncharacterized protein n=1 Tax=Citrus x changshan-huyou TaxID=2935761 RepID=A0AAP0MEZ1_9ROSI
MWKSKFKEEYDPRASRAKANHYYMSSNDDGDEFYATGENKKNEVNQIEGEAADFETHNKVNNRLNKTQNKADEIKIVIYSNL